LLATKFVWRESKAKMTELVSKVNSILDAKGKTMLSDSFDNLKGIYETIVTEEYEKSENHQTFKEVCMKMNDVFRQLFLSYMLQNPDALRDRNGLAVQANKATADQMSDMFKFHISRRLDLPPKEPITQIYPPITRLIRSLRNGVEHDLVDKPRDYITGAESYGNLYTFSSVFILAIYGYTEVLRTWLETENLDGEAVAP